jgi:sigma-B regulation protein RsbU (phosphoserine phosphatase)
MSKTPKNVDLLQQLMDNIDDNIFFKDSDSKFIMINKANAGWFGLDDPREIVGMDDFDFFKKEHALRQMEEEQWIMKTGKPVIAEEQATSRDDDEFTGWGSVTKMPLRDKNGNIIGTMGIGRDISELKNKELELKKANDQIAEDLQLAAKLQQAFLPHGYPAFNDAKGRSLIKFFHLYEADTELGGDFCSVYRLSDTKAGLLICDVMGHGVRAALITAIIHGTAEELVRNAESPGDFLTAMNQRLLPVLQTEDEYLFATAAYFTIDVVSGELTGAIAGHPLPFLIQPEQGKVTQLPVAEDVVGPALAIVADYAYESIRAQLHPGDEMLLFTDGICEAMNISQDEFGEEHLQQTILEYNKLPLKGLIPRIVEVVQEYTDSKKLGDDICLLGFSLNALPTDSQ